MFRLESSASVAPMPSERAGWKSKLPPEIEKLEPTEYAGMPPEYEKQSVVMLGNKEVIILHYYVEKGLYMVADKIDHPGKTPAYPVSPAQLRSIEGMPH